MAPPVRAPLAARAPPAGAGGAAGVGPRLLAPRGRRAGCPAFRACGRRRGRRSPGHVSDRRRLRGGPRGCAPRRRPPRPATPPRRSTPPVPTAAAGGGCRRHRPAPRPGRRAGPSPRPARRPTHRSAEPGRHLGEPRRPSAGARTPRRGRRNPRASPARPGRHRPGAADLAAPDVVALADVAAPTSRPHRRLGVSGHGRGRRPAPAGAGRCGRAEGTRRREYLAGHPRPSGFASPGPRRATSSPPIAGSAVARPAVRIPSRAPWAARLVGPPTPTPRLGLRARLGSGCARRDPADPLAPPLPLPRVSATGRHRVDHPSGRRGRGRRHGGWWVPCRSGYLCPDEHQREAIREEGRPGGRPSSRRNPAATYSPRQSPAKYHRRWRA